MQPGKVYLIPTVLEEDALHTVPPYVLDAVLDCQAFFVEVEKTARRYFKKLRKDIVIDDYEWYSIHKAEAEVRRQFLDLLKQGKNIGIVSEAGCPGVADPGQLLVQSAQEQGFIVRPLVGPSSILLALMASGMNGQCFQFNGYLPIDAAERRKKLKELEAESQRKDCTQLFIETPFRNNALIKDVLDTCRNETRFCIAADLTSKEESVATRTVQQWKAAPPDLHKHPVIFLLHAKS